MTRPNRALIRPDAIRLAKEMGLDAPKISQAQRIIDKFGGVTTLARAIGRAPSTVNRWLYPRERGGTGGRIPTESVELVARAARQEGLYLSAEDLDPRAL